MERVTRPTLCSLSYRGYRDALPTLQGGSGAGGASDEDRTRDLGLTRGRGPARVVDVGRQAGWQAGTRWL